MAVRASPAAPKVPEIRKGDTVVVLSGKDAGKRGTVERVIRQPGFAARRRAASSGAAPPPAASRSSSRASTSPSATPSRASRAGRTDRMPKIQQGGILDIAQPLPIGQVMLVCTELRQAHPHRHATLGTGAASGSAATAASSWR